MDCSFLMRCYMLCLDSWFKSYEVLKISTKLWACCQPLPMQQNMPKDNFETQLKIEIFFCFSKIKICTGRRGTRACFHHSDFQSKNFLYVFFIVKK
jgi:hypothetical protein